MKCWSSTKTRSQPPSGFIEAWSPCKTDLAGVDRRQTVSTSPGMYASSKYGRHISNVYVEQSLWQMVLARWELLLAYEPITDLALILTVSDIFIAFLSFWRLHQLQYIQWNYPNLQNMPVVYRSFINRTLICRKSLLKPVYVLQISHPLLSSITWSRLFYYHSLLPSFESFFHPHVCDICLSCCDVGWAPSLIGLSDKKKIWPVRRVWYLPAAVP